MGVINKLQASFSKGEISPRLLGRADSELYQTALQTCINYLILKFGGAYNRPGLKFVKPLEDQTKSGRLIKFIYSNQQAYILEFTNLALRFYTDQGLILQSRGVTNGNFNSSISGWTALNSGTGSISYDSLNKRLQLNSTGVGNEARAVATPLENLGTSQYTVKVDVFNNSVTYKVGTSQGVSDIGTGVLTTGLLKTFSFTPSTNTTVYITFQSIANASITNVILDNAIYKINTPYSSTELDDLRYTQSFDTLVITHANHKPMQLQRVSDDNWVLSNIVFDEPAYLDANVEATTITPSATSGSITVTASSAIFASTDIGRVIRYKAGPDSADTINYGSATGTQTNYNIPFFPNTSADIDVYLQEATGSYTLQTLTTDYTVSNGQVIFVVAPTSGKRPEIRRRNSGSGEWNWMTITGYTSPTVVTASVNRTLSGTFASKFWRLGAWSDTTGYPRLCVFYQQRLFFANNLNNPRGIWASGTGDIYNFAPDNILHKGQVDSDTAFTYSLSVTAINWMAGQKVLLVGTNEGLVNLGGVLSGLNPPEEKRDTSVPCAFADITTTAEEVIFVEALNKRIYAVGYSFESDGYKPSEVSLLAEHMVGDSGYKTLAYADTPGKILWLLRSDGIIRSCTYVKDQSMTGWARHTIGGTNVQIESIAVIPGESYSELWCIVSRTINGSTKRYVEVMQKEFFQAEKEDAFFVDSGLTYSGPAAAVITGLDHLEGQTVSINKEGAGHPTRVVTGGSITLESAATIAQIGLGYLSEFETIGQEGGSATGTSQSKTSRSRKINIKFYETIGGVAGLDSSNSDPLLWKDIGSEIGAGAGLYSGWKEALMPYGYKKEYKAYVKQHEPLPSTILSVVFSASVSDR